MLADTSVWIDHFRNGGHALAILLERGQVLTHPFVIGELTVGNLAARELVLGPLAELPQATTAAHIEVMRLVEQLTLFGRGIGFVDAHLLAATMLTSDARLWTRDRRLGDIADEHELAFPG